MAKPIVREEHHDCWAHAGEPEYPDKLLLNVYSLSGCCPDKYGELKCTGISCPTGGSVMVPAH